MTSKKFYSIFFVLTITVLVSCKSNDVKPFTTDAAFEPYVQKFIAEAKKRNKTVDFNGSDLSIVFSSKLPGGAAGYADVFNKKITIDSSGWRNMSDNIREEVMFHEFGHYFLDRGHLIDLMPNGEARSMMEGNPWAGHVLYRGMRKKYFIDELFDSNTPNPYWADANFQPVIPNNRKAIGSFMFDDAKKWGNLVNKYTGTASITNGSLVFKQIGDKSITLNIDDLLTNIPQTLPIQKTTDYEIEITYSLEKGTGTVAWFGTEKQDYDNYFLFLFTSENKTDGSFILSSSGGIDLSLNNLAINKIVLKRYAGYQSIWYNGRMVLYADVLNPSTSADLWKVLLSTLSDGSILKINSINVSQII